MFYDLNTIKSLNTTWSDFFFTPSRFRQARQWFIKNAERCRANYDPDKVTLDFFADAAVSYADIWKWNNIQGVYIYKDREGWHADILLCDGHNIHMFGIIDDYPRNRHLASLYAEALLHVALAHEQNAIKDCRKAVRYNWTIILKGILGILSRLSQVTVEYPTSAPLTIRGLDDGNNYEFLLKIDAPIPPHLIKAAQAEWDSRAGDCDPGWRIMPIGYENSRDTAAIVTFGFFLLVCDFSDPATQVLHLKVVTPEAGENVEAFFGKLESDFQFLRNIH